MVRIPSRNGRGEEADDRSTLLLMLGIYVLIPSLASNLGLGSGGRLPCWHSISSSPSPSKSSFVTSLLIPLHFPLSSRGIKSFTRLNRLVIQTLYPCRSPMLTYSAYLPNPIYHQIAFAAILISSVGRLLYLTHCLPASSSKHKLINTFLKGIAIFAGGFGIWNIDNIFCHQLRTIRDFLGPVLGMVVQGHGFWHLMTGYGSYLIFTAAICKSSPSNNSDR
jgi:hypothetical protein